MLLSASKRLSLTKCSPLITSYFLWCWVSSSVQLEGWFVSFNHLLFQGSIRSLPHAVVTGTLNTPRTSPHGLHTSTYMHLPSTSKRLLRACSSLVIGLAPENICLKTQTHMTGLRCCCRPQSSLHLLFGLKANFSYNRATPLASQT